MNLFLTFKEKYSERITASNLRSKTTESKINNVLTENTKIIYRNELVADVNVQVFRNVMRFDIDIKPAFHRLGMYQLQMAKAIERHPETGIIPSSMQFENSESALLFAKNMAGSFENFIAMFSFSNISKMTALERLKFRNKIIKQLESIPAMKVRNRLGFSNFESVLITVDPEFDENLPGEFLDDDVDYELYGKGGRDRFFLENYAKLFLKEIQ